MTTWKCAVAGAAILLSGCGTIDTVFRPDDVTAKRLAEWRSDCEAVPRVYSGVALDYCQLSAPPVRPGQPQGESMLRSALVDIAFSGVLDTVLIPYTIYLQSDRGSIPAHSVKLSK